MYLGYVLLGLGWYWLRPRETARIVAAL
jgi:hypothetical protein